MSKGLLFWILMILWVLIWIFGPVVVNDKHVIYVGYGSNILLFILFVILGWKVFGAPVKDD